MKTFSRFNVDDKTWDASVRWSIVTLVLKFLAHCLKLLARVFSFVKIVAQGPIGVHCTGQLAH